MPNFEFKKDCVCAPAPNLALDSIVILVLPYMTGRKDFVLWSGEKGHTVSPVSPQKGHRGKSGKSGDTGGVGTQGSPKGPRASPPQAKKIVGCFLTFKGKPSFSKV